MKLLKRIADKKKDLWSQYSDMYKDENGFRPRISQEDYDKTTVEEIQSWIDEISDDWKKERNERQKNDDKLKAEQPEYDSIKESLYDEYVELCKSAGDSPRWNKKNLENITIEDIQEAMEEEQKYADIVEDAYGDKKKENEEEQAEDDYYQGLENSVKQRHRREKYSSKKRLIRVADDSAKEAWIAEELKQQDEEESLALGLELGCDWANDVVEFTEENLNMILQNMCQNYEQAFTKGWNSDVNFSHKWLFVNTDESISSDDNLRNVINYEDLAAKLLANPITDHVPQNIIDVLNKD